MKRSWSYVIAGLAVVLVAVALLSGASPVHAQDPAAREIRVSGEGIISLKPDMAYVTLGIDTQAVSASSAQRRTNEISGKILKALKDLGIAEEDVATVDFRLYPERRYDENKKQDVLVGYHSVHNLRVTVRKIDQTGSVIDALVDVGGNVIQDISFSLKDSSAARERALETAVKDATRKAETIARTAGVKLTGITRITDTTGPSNPPVVMMRKDAAFAASQAQVAAGSIEVKATVEMVFSF